MSILNALRGIGGEYEVQRVLGALGTITYTLVTPIFVAAGTIKDVGITEFSLAYPAGLAACIAATAGAIAIKDRSVATATVIRDTGGQPSSAGPSGGVQDVKVVNSAASPVPVEPAS